MVDLCNDVWQEQARLDGRALMELLKKVLHGLDRLEQEALPVLTSATRPTSPRSLSEEARKTTKDLLTAATELKDVVTSFKPQSGNMDMEGGDLDDDDEGVSVEAMRARLESETETAMDTVKGTLDAIGPLLDPPPHSSIFGLDVLRGTVLSRYKGSKQLWIPRPSGGKLDAIYIPSPKVPANGKRKAVLYCNPNAGLIEVATGMSLSGGNVVPPGTKSHPSWADYYTENGFDVFLFNYAGFGRSDGRHLCAIGNPTRARGIYWCYSTHLSFHLFDISRYTRLYMTKNPSFSILFITFSLTFFLYPILFSRRRNHFGMMVPPLASTLYPIQVIAHW